MADDVLVNPDSGSAAVPVATDDVGGRHYQWIKVGHGGDGAFLPVAKQEPLPVQDAGQSATPPRALQYARDESDRMRVAVATLPAVAVATLPARVPIYPVDFPHLAAAGTPVTFMAAGSQFSMDAREEHKANTLQSFYQQRSRWAVT